MNDWSDHPAAPPVGMRLCGLDELPEVGGKEVIFQEGAARFRVVVLRHQGRVLAYVNGCKHFPGTPLNPNNVGNFLHPTDASLIRCGVHGALYRVESGECVRGDCIGEFLDPVPVTVRGDAVLIGG